MAKMVTKGDNNGESLDASDFVDVHVDDSHYPSLQSGRTMLILLVLMKRKPQAVLCN